MHHFAERLQQRYGINIDRTHIRKINTAIQGGRNEIEVEFVKKKTQRVSVWLVFIKNIWALCYYDKKIHSVITCVEREE